MDKMGYPHGLIRNTTQNAIDGGVTTVMRPRIWVYGLLLLGLLSAFTYGLANRSTMIADILRDRNALYRETATGLENGYTLKIANKTDVSQDYLVSLDAKGAPLNLRAMKPVHVAAGDVVESPLLVDGPKAIEGRHAVEFKVQSADGASQAVVKSSFFGKME
jgi:polyferredoxin